MIISCKIIMGLEWLIPIILSGLYYVAKWDLKRIDKKRGTNYSEEPDFYKWDEKNRMERIQKDRQNLDELNARITNNHLSVIQ